MKSILDRGTRWGRTLKSSYSLWYIERVMLNDIRVLSDRQVWMMCWIKHVKWRGCLVLRALLEYFACGIEKLFPWNIVLLEKFIIPQLVKKLSAFYKVHYRVHKSSSLGPAWARWNQFTTSQPTFIKIQLERLKTQRRLSHSLADLRDEIRNQDTPNMKL